MKTSRIIASTALLTGLISQTSLALPTLYPAVSSNIKNIRNPTNSTVLADTENPHQYYVLPPKEFKVTTGDFRLNANAGFCEEMADLQSYSRQLATRIKAIGEDLASLGETAKAKQEVANRKAEEANKYYLGSKFLIQVNELQSAIDDKTDRVDALREQQVECTEEAVCESLAEEISQLQKEIREQKKELTEVKKQNREELKTYERLSQEAERAREEASAVGDELIALNGKVITFKQQILSMYKDFAKMEGGFGSISYQSGWTANVSALSAANPGSSFSAIQTQDSKVYTQFIAAASQDSYLASLPAILDYTVAGRFHSPYNDSGADFLPSVPENFTSSVRLSLVGACPIKNPALYDLTKDNTGLPKFGVSATYNYPVGITSRLEINYNLYRVYSKMIKNSETGGLFSSKAEQKVREDSWDKSDMDVKWLDEGSTPEEKLTAEDKAAIEKSIKDELMGEVLNLQAVPLADGQGAPGAAPTPPRRGSLVVADGLQNSCGWYSWYCTGGAWVLRGLDSIFGSSTSTLDFQKTHDITVKRTWSRTEARLRPGSTSY